MQKQTISQNAEARTVNDGEMLDEASVCAFYGGVRPIHRSTLHRGVKSGRFPKPIKIGPKTNRWRRCELQEDMSRRIAEREAV